MSEQAKDQERERTKRGGPAEHKVDPHGESRPVSPTAPPSAGKPTGDEGDVDVRHDSDARPQDTRGVRPVKPKGETPVPDPALGEAGRTASAGGASAAAGSESPIREPEPNPRRGEEEMEEASDDAEA